MDESQLIVDKSTVEDRLRYIERLASSQQGDRRQALDAIRHHAGMALLKLEAAAKPLPTQL